MSNGNAAPQTNIFLKLLLIGDMGVGKSSLLFRYTDDHFSNTYISTIGVDFKVKTVMIDGLRVKLQIWDTAGQDRFRTITSTYYRGAHGLIVVYDVNDVRTFFNVQRWMKEASIYTDQQIAKILVGNKNDNPEFKTVATHDAERLAAHHSSLFIETSAKADDNVNEMFDRITREALRLRLNSADQLVNGQQPGTIKLHPVDNRPPNRKRKCCSGGDSNSDGSYHDR